MNERQFNQRIITLVPVASPLQTTKTYTVDEIRAKRTVLEMAIHHRDSAQRTIDRLMKELEGVE
jgi:hypothetical protein